MPEQLGIVGFEPLQPVPTTFAVVNGQRVPVDDVPDQGPEQTPALGIANFTPAGSEAPEEEPQNLTTFAKHVGAGINPLTAVQTIGNALLDPVNTAKRIGAAQGALYDKAATAYRRGDYVTAARHFVDYLMPLVGPAIDKSSDELQAGKWASGGGDAIGLALSMFGPDAIASARAASAATAARAGKAAPAVMAPVRKMNLTPTEEASNAFATANNVPLDAATATGSPFVRGVQKVAGESMLGSGTASKLKGAQADALERVGGELSERTGGAALTPESGGQAVSDAVNGLIARLKGRADTAYGKLRAIEDAAEADTVPAADRSATVHARQARETQSAGRVVSDAERGELQRIQSELEAMPYRKAEWSDVGPGAADGNAGGGHSNRTAGGAGAPVFGDIEAHFEGDRIDTYDTVARQIQDAIATGNYQSGAAKAALEVARKRLAGKFSGIEGVTRPRLPESAREIPAGATQAMQLAVDMQDAQKALRPAYDDLVRQSKLAPLTGEKADVLRALDKIVNGPQHARATDAEAALGTIKALARNTEEARPRALALKVADELQQAIDLRVGSHSDDAIEALRAGRTATREKYQAKDLLDVVQGARDEPVRAFDKLTAPRDANVNLLRQVAEKAPESLPELGRAKLQQWLDLASERGRFDHADRMYAEWNKVGPETKRLLFGKELTPELDKFFLLAKRIAENPNPSGTAGTAIKTAEVVGALTHPLASLPASLSMGALSKLLYTPRGVAAVTRLMKTVPTTGRAAGGGLAAVAAQKAAYLELANAARDAGVSVPLPMAADRDAQR